MPISIDETLAFHTEALLMHSRRADVLAANVANVDTPGFKARDVDFRAALRDAMTDLPMAGDHTRHVATHTSAGGALLYRQPHQVSADGNTVEMQVEKAEFMRNALLYSANLTFLDGKVNGLLSAVRGGQ